jgi:hypothetical protein
MSHHRGSLVPPAARANDAIGAQRRTSLPAQHSQLEPMVSPFDAVLFIPNVVQVTAKKHLDCDCT